MRELGRAKTAKKTVLVVDDESGIVDVLVAVLVEAGFGAAGAAHGEEALSKLAVSLPDVVLLDLEMPVLDGAETLRAMKEDPRFAALPVILMSGILEKMVRRRCRGFDAFLRKPFTLDELLTTLNRLLARRGTSRRAKAAKRRSPPRRRKR